MELPQSQVDVLMQLKVTGPDVIPGLANTLRMDQSLVSATCESLQDAGYIAIEENAYQELRLGPEAEYTIDIPLPERVIVGVLAGQGGRCKLTEVPNHCDLTASQVGGALRWLNQRKWARKEEDMLVLADAAPAADGPPTADEQLIKALAGGRVARRPELEAEGLPVADALKLLSKRKGFLVIKERTERRVRLTDAGRELLAGGVKGRKKVTQLTPELLAEGGWREVEIQPYDVTLAAKKLYPGKEHPFQRTIDRVRRVFLEMGFEEIVSPWVESSFWDFDALFQPQDHPARDMQDTFYVGRPDHCQLPDEQYVERIKNTHENGGDTGSTGWQYRWSRDLAHKPVLRTHTTSATIRALARHTQGRPGKYFIIGPVFRRETADYKHLPVFHQVDGIIVDKHASLANLVGTLSAFYHKMGFPKVKVVPSFFPYTEPSAEVLLYLENRRDWVEMGGSGIFRPEVTLPVGITDRVLAWGLGLERLAMMVHDLKSIGELFYATMPWLREEPLCRS
ncbi:MAG: phenylalanine--tRNA ligase subunit alpha [Phycisphaerae bacterium]|nr:phenylalanine--tRNA ligase subunit alpha [Phycisphaerae bacterium]